MPEPAPTYRLNDLKLRWERDPSSRLFLQLADEYRKLGQVAEAVSVLEKGLEHRPNDLSAMVALGRCRLELEDVEKASELLENVVTRDPTHIVANKLLLDANLQMGDAQKAGERLETYRLLNDRDPELDHLAYRLERLKSEEKTEASTVVAREAFELEEETTKVVEIVSSAESATSEASVFEEMTVEEVPAFEEVAEAAPEPTPLMPKSRSAATLGEETIFDLAPPARPSLSVNPLSNTRGGDLFSLGSEPAPAPDLGALWRKPSPENLSKEDPFAGLIRIDATRHWDLLSQEGIFSGPRVPTPPGDELVGDEIQIEVADPVGASAEDAETDQAPAPAIEVAEVQVEPVASEPEAVVGEADDLVVADFEEEVAVDHVADPGEPSDDSSVLGLMAGLSAAAGIAAVAAGSNAEEELPYSSGAPVGLEPVEPEPVELASAESESVDPELVEFQDATQSQESHEISRAAEATESPLTSAEEPDPWAPEPAVIESEQPEQAVAEPTAEVSTSETSTAEVKPVEVEPVAGEPVAAGPVETEAFAAESAETPSAETPSAETPSVETPSVETQSAGTGASEPASVTLGNLYLEQGHREEAEQIFHKVLEREPDSQVAREGLARLAARRRPLTAADLLAVRSANGKIPEGLTAKKVLVLGNYVRQIRASQHVH